jgi:hypothetical protein
MKIWFVIQKFCFCSILLTSVFCFVLFHQLSSADGWCRPILKKIKLYFILLHKIKIKIKLDKTLNPARTICILVCIGDLCVRWTSKDERSQWSNTPRQSLKIQLHRRFHLPPTTSSSFLCRHILFLFHPSEYRWSLGPINSSCCSQRRHRI